MREFIIEFLVCREVEGTIKAVSEKEAIYKAMDLWDKGELEFNPLFRDECVGFDNFQAYEVRE